MCTFLSTVSGKCDKNNNENKGSENLACGFIKSLHSGSYDENGEMVLDKGLSVSNNWNLSEIKAHAAAMSPGMQAGLAISALAATGMLIYAIALNVMLKRRKKGLHQQLNPPMTSKNDQAKPEDDVAGYDGPASGADAGSAPASADVAHTDVDSRSKAAISTTRLV